MHLNLTLSVSGGPGSSWGDRENPKPWRAGGPGKLQQPQPPVCSPSARFSAGRALWRRRRQKILEVGGRRPAREAGPQCPGGDRRRNLCGQDFSLGFFPGLAWHRLPERGQTLQPPVGPGPAGHYDSAQLTRGRGMGKLLETLQSA